MELKKFNIIYGENGRGKSTFSVILHSLCSGDPTLILERKTVDSNNQPEIQLRLESATSTFKDGKWDKILPDLEIFDSNFISNNIYSGNTIDVEQRRNLHQFVLGQDGVNNVNTINKCEETLKSIKTLISKCETKIQQNIFGRNIDVSTFVGLSHDPIASTNIDDEIDSKENEANALRKAKELIAKEKLDLLFLPEIPRSRLETILHKTIEGISQDAERITCEHFSKFTDHEGENWIQKGLNYINNNNCPFCNQSVLNNSLIVAYQYYFGATYTSFKKEIHDFSEEMKDCLSDDKLLTIQKVLISNNLMAEFWKEYIVLEYNNLTLADIQETWKKYFR